MFGVDGTFVFAKLDIVVDSSLRILSLCTTWLHTSQSCACKYDRIDRCNETMGELSTGSGASPTLYSPFIQFKEIYRM